MIELKFPYHCNLNYPSSQSTHCTNIIFGSHCATVLRISKLTSSLRPQNKHARVGDGKQGIKLQYYNHIILGNHIYQLMMHYKVVSHNNIIMHSYSSIKTSTHAIILISTTVAYLHCWHFVRLFIHTAYNNFIISGGGGAPGAAWLANFIMCHR